MIARRDARRLRPRPPAAAARRSGLAALIKQHGPCGLAAAQRGDHFSALVRAITNQQLSTKAAATIYRPAGRADARGHADAGGSRCADRRAAARGRATAVRRSRYLRDLVRSTSRRHRSISHRSTIAGRRGGHRGADAGEGHRPLVGGDVPDVPAASARRPAGRRPRHRQRHPDRQYRLRKTPTPDRIRRIGRERGSRTGRWPAGTCGEASTTSPEGARVACSTGRPRYTRGFRLPAGTSFNGRTPRSGRGYWGSNPYVPASLRSPDPARASARQAQFSGLPPTSGNCKRRLSRRSPRSGRSRTSPQSNSERLSRRSYEAAKADHSPESATRRRVQVKESAYLSPPILDFLRNSYWRDACVIRHMHGVEKRIVYIIRSDVDPSLHYVGITNDLRARLEWHNHGPCGHTQSHRPWSMPNFVANTTRSRRSDRS